MKNYFFIFLLLFSLNGFSQKIRGKVTYIVSMESYTKEKIDSTSKNLKTKNVKMDKWMRDVFENTPDVKAFLEFNNRESLYFVEEKVKYTFKQINYEKSNIKSSICASYRNNFYKRIFVE